MEQNMTVLDGGIKQISLSGRLDIQGSAEIETQFTIHSASERAAVLVDMSNVEFISSMGIRLLLSNAKAQVRRGGQMVLYNPQSMVKDVLVSAGIDELIPIFDNFDAATAQLTAAASK